MMFNENWVGLAGFALLLGLLLQQNGLLAIAILLLAATTAGWAWNKYCLQGIVYSRSFSERRAFLGETVDLDLQVTNGKLLLEKVDEIIGNLNTLAVSVFEKDSEADEQLGIIEEFLKRKGTRKPYTLLRLNGRVDERRYEHLGLRFARRILHSPMGSFDYQRMDPTMPEIGICLDFLHHLAINKDGKVLADVVPTGIRPRFADKLRLSGIELPQGIFDRNHQ